MLENTKGSEDTKKRWEKSITSDNTTKRVEIREVENGYIVKYSKDVQTDDGWDFESKEYISKENPIKNMEGFEEFQDSSKKEETDLLGGIPGNELL
jgi:hypothetical protein